MVATVKAEAWLVSVSVVEEKEYREGETIRSEPGKEWG